MSLDDDACLYRQADRGLVDDLRAAGISAWRGRPKAVWLAADLAKSEGACAFFATVAPTSVGGKSLCHLFREFGFDADGRGILEGALMSGSQPTNNAAVDFEKQQAAEADQKEARTPGASDARPAGDRPDFQWHAGDGHQDQQFRLVDLHASRRPAPPAMRRSTRAGRHAGSGFRQRAGRLQRGAGRAESAGCRNAERAPAPTRSNTNSTACPATTPGG